MNLRAFGLTLSLLVVAACSREKDVRLCNQGTLLLNFECFEDLEEADGLEFQLSRNGLEGTLVTSLSCPGKRAYEVAITDYAQDQVFQIRATPLKGTEAAGQLNQLADVVLAPGCTAVQFPVTAEGGIVQPPKEDAGPGTGGSDDTQEAGVPDAGDDANTIPVERGSKENGIACAEGPECMSGFCADGVCCNNACEGACNACDLAGSPGKCTETPAGQKPSGSKSCQTQAVETCGFDGTCNGEGQCRKYPDQTACAPGQCDGGGTRGRKVCMAGSCSSDSDLACAPYGCDPAGVKCFSACESNAQCAAGQSCELDPDTNKKSCGKKPLGAVCGTGPECESGHCADGVCCGTACEGACRSCKLVGKVGECNTVPAGADDPRAECKATAAGMCGQTGKCDANGACSRYAKGTVCAAAKCDGNDGVPPSECDGNGSCVSGRPVPCAPFVCGGNACLIRCETNAECTEGTSCVNNSCGLLPDGANCLTANQCKSSFCADGVCCNSACGGTCQFCNSATAKGTCTDVAAGVEDPRKKCETKLSSTCETNGKCNGMRECQLWAQGTECQARSCDVANNREIYAKQCDGAGKCNEVRAPRSCAPFTCGGNACANTCSRPEQCVAPDTCDLNTSLCGKKSNGQACGSPAQCESGHCQQGFCCATACSGTCKSCAVENKRGTCENVPSGLDLHNNCESTPNNGCKTTGACNGAGACAVYDSTVICEVAKCSADTSQEIGASTCDGAGTCKAPAGITCQNNLVCTGTSCKGSCSGNADCRNGTVCNATTKQCAKANGQTCGAASECGSNHCKDGFCCNTACSGVCESCRGSDTGAANGVCTAIPNGNIDGTCAPAECVGNNSARPAAVCNGSRACTMPTAVSCEGFSCSNGVCLKSCSAQNSCTDPNMECVISSGQCKKKKGVACAPGTGAECASTFCAPDGICCDKACTGPCKICGVTGTCVDHANGESNECPASPSTCGNTGACENGACKQLSAGDQCGPAKCYSLTNIPTHRIAVSTCSSGSCAQPGPVSCAPGLCSNGACIYTCSDNANCASDAFCSSNGTCIAKLAPGATCANSGQCANNKPCVDNVCCESACADQCRGCNEPGQAGKCVIVTGAPRGMRTQCTNGGMGCGGSCNGSNASCVYPGTTSTVQCAAPICSATHATPARTCNGSGQCSAVTSTPCAGPCNTCSGGSCTQVSNGSQATGCNAPHQICSNGSCVCALGRKDCNGDPSDGCECFEMVKNVQLQVAGRFIAQSRCRLSCGQSACIVEGNRGEVGEYAKCDLTCNVGSKYEICCSNGNVPCGGSYVVPYQAGGANQERGIDDLSKHTTSSSLAGQTCTAPTYDRLQCSGTVPNVLDPFSTRVVWTE